MGKIRRGNFLFIFWEGDYSPRHVNVYREGRLVVKWDLENDKSMQGEAIRQILKYINELRSEGRV